MKKSLLLLLLCCMALYPLTSFARSFPRPPARNEEPMEDRSEYVFAYLKADGSNLIIIPIHGEEMRDKGEANAQQVLDNFKQCMADNGFKGVTFIAWTNSRGSMSFRGPTSWHPYMKRKNMAWIYRNAKRRVACYF